MLNRVVGAVVTSVIAGISYQFYKQASLPKVYDSPHHVSIRRVEEQGQDRVYISGDVTKLVKCTPALELGTVRVRLYDRNDKDLPVPFYKPDGTVPTPTGEISAGDTYTMSNYYAIIPQNTEQDFVLGVVEVPCRLGEAYGNQTTIATWGPFPIPKKNSNFLSSEDFNEVAKVLGQISLVTIHQ